MILKDKLLKSVAKSPEMNEEELEIVAYGMEILFQKIFFFIGAIIISLAMRSLIQGIVFMVLFSILRQNAGGVHMNTKISCAASSAALFIASLVLINLAVKYSEAYFVLLCLSGAGMVILLLLAPVDTPNKRIPKNQKKKISLKVKIIILGFYVIFFISSLLEFKLLCSAIIVTVIIESILVVVGKILLNSLNI